jgi:hypothetical protein
MCELNITLQNRISLCTGERDVTLQLGGSS